MKDFKGLNLGVYKIYWKKRHGGGHSLASVGQTYNGTRWYAPCNWTSENNDYPSVASTDWSKIKKVEQIA